MYIRNSATLSSTVDVLMDILDYAFYFFVHSMRKHAIHIPHSAKINAQCRILNLKLSGFVKVGINKEKDGRDIFPIVEELKGSFAVLPSSLTATETICVIEAGLYDETGNIIYEKREF